VIDRLLRGRLSARHAGREGFQCTRCGHAHARGQARYCRRCGAPNLARAAPQAVPAPSVAAPSAARPLSAEVLLGPPPIGAVERLVALQRAAAKNRPSQTKRGHRSRLSPLTAEYSAQQTLSRGQGIALRWFIASSAICLLINPIATLIAAIALVTLMYVGAFVYRLRIFWRALSSPSEIKISDQEARGLWPHSLPTYTILVPAFREPEVIGGLIASLERLEYPSERLDIKLLLEEDDAVTIAAAEAAAPGTHIQIVRVPRGDPQTKPRACNFGLLTARGKFVTIYDAEDRPEPLQLRRAVAAFRKIEDRYVCLQAKLSYHNPDQNNITRWFTTEYAMWFSHLLPGLIMDNAPLPLGGTSNHFRREVLDALGGWDPWNVTEDADLGIRLHRAGYRTAVLDSTTYEEANSDFINWIKQRSRWYKGYMQTWLVHMRHPRQLLRELGIGGFIGFHLFVGGTPLLTLVNPIFWALTAVWFISPLEVIRQLFPAWLYYAGLFCLVFGNVAFVYSNMVAARQAGRADLVIAATISPLYWVMMSLAAIKALVQLIHAPSFWEKTVHGLDRDDAARQAEREADSVAA
jgi:cellulose synthase/poly-beta-1,6-N-acetylglucosamine synthase-like glycosyltransferase